MALKREQSVEDRVLALEYFEEKTERHIGEMKESMQVISTDVTDIKNAIIGNKLNGETGFVQTIASMKKKQDADSETLSTHKVYFRQIAWFVGVVSAVIVGIIVKIFTR